MGNSTIVMALGNYAGDTVRFNHNNARRAHCKECGIQLDPGRGVKRSIKGAAGSGYLCAKCAGDTIIDWARRANTPGFYSFNRFSATLVPFDGTCASYALPALELAQAWADHGTFGLRFAAENLREQARTEFMAAHKIPTNKVNLSGIPASPAQLGVLA